MKIGNVKVRVKGRQKLSPKIYEYTIKNLSSIRFDDLVDIMGIDVACKLLDVFSGGYMYIPKKSTIKKDFLHAIIRKEAEQLYKAEETPNMEKIVYTLANKYNFHAETIYRILGIKYSIKENKDKFKQKHKIDKIRDENLLNLLKNNWDKLTSHGLI